MTKISHVYSRLSITNLSLLLCLVSLITSAQNIQFAHFGLSEGLPQETIHCMDKDELGFVWLGTSDGIVRFDGQSFFVPEEDQESKLDLSGWRIGALIVKDTIVYAGTGQKGLITYDILNEKTNRIGKDNSNCTGLIQSKNSLIASYYDGEIISIRNKTEVTSLNFNKNLLKQIVSVASHKEYIYLVNDLGEIFSFKESELSETSIALNFVLKVNSSINKIISLNDSLYILTTNGLYTLDQNTNLIPVNLLGDYDFSDTISFTGIKSFNNQLYLATDKGLLRGSFSKEENSIVINNWSKASVKYDIYALNRNSINDIMIHQDNLFIGHNSLDITRLSNKPVFESITSKFNLGNPSTFAILETKNNLWIGTTSGLVISNKKTDSFNLLPEFRIRAMDQDADGNIWVGTSTGVKLFLKKDLEKSNYVYKSINITYKEEKIIQNIRDVYKDNDDNIWILTFNSGVFRFTGSINNNEYTFEMYGKSEDGILLPSIFTIKIIQDVDNNYWITSQKGLTRLQFSDKNFENPVYTNYTEKSGLITNGVLAPYMTSDGQLWVTSRKGINKYIKATNTFKSYGKRDGLTNTFVYDALEEDENYLWLSTNGGLFRFDVENEIFTNYTIKDGIQSSEFNLGAAYKYQSSDLLYFGGINGLNLFNPKRIGELDKEGSLTLTYISKKGKGITNTKTNPIFFRKNIDIEHDEFPIELKFSALDFRPEKNQTFQYRLLPGDSLWNNLNTTNNIQLLNLAPKNYTLQIQGKSRNELWKQPPLELKIKVSPPWYKSNLAYLSYLLLFLGIVYAFYKVSLQRQIAGQESKRLQDLDDLKSRFITNITHEFRTPLTIILGYLGNLKERFSSKDDVNASLNTIEQNSNNLLDLVNQMLDLAKLEKGQLNVNLIQNDIVAFTSQIIDSFKSIASDKQIELQYNANPNEIIMDFDAEKIRQILTNLISNALKFSPKDSELKIHLVKTKANSLKIEVTDQGYGIAEGELPYIFDRFYQVENTEHKVSQGTGVGLALTKELVELFNGTINVTSEINKGTSFTIQLPITNTAASKDIEQIERQITIGTVVPQTDDIIIDDDANSVLIVEDNADMARYIASCLKPEYKVTFAKNGKEGLDMATSKIPDIIVTDVMMPIMDGFELTQKLQADTNTNHIPIIMLTSKAMQEDRLEGITRGADAYLTKPFQKRELQLRMQMLIAKRKQLQERYAVNTIVEHKEEQPKPTDKKLIFLNAVIDTIHQHIEDSNFGATELAKFLAMSDSQLYRKLKAISNTSTAVFIRKVRLEKGKDLLKTSDLSISEIAYAVGFNDPNWFSKTFKEEFKQSPTEFRK